ncbi:proline racemase family protein [Akkermansiaceae bacterium]|nr:proline racemase family protein [Akkermansiaceae bacterium]MDB4321767.1 proline racemase family protein [Akkermansiaceae bacterium]MDB4381977.1 proline racemase family protein [Akkermansiaceae bacterium]MDB4411882.1 proline racemase family protein [Akkermansiaceae bacterium]MDC1404059.1 proline racemase family protein [Akkermansiaceae bacterium]
MMKKIQVIDSHTGGEPTRVVIDGAPTSPEVGALAARDFLESKHDWLRRALILEPRGFEAIVGAFLCEPTDPACVTGVVFFNNTSYLNGCLHGTIGVVATLAHLEKITPGDHRVETPSGVVTATLADDGTVTANNVPSYRFIENQVVEVPGYGSITGDIAWGGNWFFLIQDQGPEVRFSEIEALTHFTSAVMKALEENKIRGAYGGVIDHIETFGPPQEGVKADSQNFVLCPGKAYDRSPCGTGTSAKLACLAASGKLAEGETWRQAGIIGTAFEGSFLHLPEEGKVTPIIRGKAHITAESTFLLDPSDPFQFGIGS